LRIFRTGGRVEIPSGPERGDQPLDEHRGTEREQAPSDKKPAADPDLVGPDRIRRSDPDAPAGVEVKVLLLPEDPPYEVGSQVFLALTEGPEGTMRPVAPSARYEVATDGKVRRVVGDDMLAASIEGRNLDELRRAARGEAVIAAPTDADRRVTTGGGEAVGMPTTGGHHDSFQWIVFFELGLLMVSAGVVMLVLPSVKSTLARLRRRS
jgi:hypothetical protein